MTLQFIRGLFFFKQVIKYKQKVWLIGPNWENYQDAAGEYEEVSVRGAKLGIQKFWRLKPNASESAQSAFLPQMKLFKRA